MKKHTEQGEEGMSVKELIKKKIDMLPENLLEKIYDFIQFLKAKKERAQLVKPLPASPTSSFKKVWDNAEDAIYDNLQGENDNAKVKE